MSRFVNAVIEGIWKDRYRKNGETVEDGFRRVANHCSKVKSDQEAFYKVMDDGLFYPAGRTVSNAGVGRDLTLNNCFVAPLIPDDLEKIFDTVGLGAKTHQKGGGIGYEFSQLRPKGTPTSNDAIASGPVSFIDVFNAQTATILQGGRRGANMGVLSVYHPDIEEFIMAKSYEAKKLEHFNVSVMVDDDFMNAVRADETIHLHWPVYDDDGLILKDPSKWRISKEASAREIWDLIMKKAYDNGEPGIFQYDNLNRDNTIWYAENIVCTNPCAEYLAGTVYGTSPETGKQINSSKYGGACNLGSLMLHNFVKNPFRADAAVDYASMRDAVAIGVRFLDNIIDINKFPDTIYKNYQMAFRTIGLGVTGLADMLTMLGLKYNTREAHLFVYDLMDEIAYTAYKTSVELAKEKGSFPFLDREKFVESGYLKKHADGAKRWEELCDDILKHGIRNAKIMSIAPTGTMSLTFGNNCSSGIEPIFSLSYDRKVKVGGQDEENEITVKMQDYAYGLWLQVPEEERVVTEDVFVTAMSMSVDDHIEMLRHIAYHVDMSVSKTINVPSDYPYEKVKDIYFKCWEYGIKGCTIFRPNEIRQGVLIAESQREEAPKEELKRGEVVHTSDGLIGLKRKLTTGCGTLHCSAFFDPDTGDLMETYLSKGSTGGCLNSLTGLSRMISLSARAGLSIEQIADQLDSCGVCPSYAVRAATKKDTSKGASCPIAVGKALTEMHGQVVKSVAGCDGAEAGTTKHDPLPVKKAVVTKAVSVSGVCPECGEGLVQEGGCSCCKSCGYSKCS